MSRVGRAPVVFDKTVQVSVTPDNIVVVKGAKATEKVKLPLGISVEIKGNEILLANKNEGLEFKAYHGLSRALIQNAVTGVTKGFLKELELNGVGYRAAVSGKNLDLTLGFSHPIAFPIPVGIEIKVEKQTQISIRGSNKELVGQVAARIRSLREPEPYLGKGVKYSDEVIRRKAGKSAAKTA